jgi:hypothetical protein
MAAQLTFIPGVGFVKDPQTGNTSFIPGAGLYQEEPAAPVVAGDIRNPRLRLQPILVQ